MKIKLNYVGMPLGQPLYLQDYVLIYVKSYLELKKEKKTTPDFILRLTYFCHTKKAGNYLGTWGAERMISD